MQLSERISRISLSTIATVLQKAEKLKHRDTKLADFGAGEPDFPTPDHIKLAAIKAIEENFTKYTATGGIKELRQALVEKHAKDHGSNYTVEECLVTVGGKQAIFEAMCAALNDGDEVILPTPYWVTFLEIIKYAGGKPVLFETLESENFAVHAKGVEKLITPKTKLLVVNSPHNPTGAVVPPGEMEKLLELAVQHKLLLLSDECYSHFLYDGRKPFSLGSSKEREHLLIVDSFSKTYAMTGWRVGFALGSTKLLANMLKLQSHSTSNPNSVRPDGRAGGNSWDAGPCAHDAGGIPAAPGSRHRRTAIYTRHSLCSSAWRLLRLPECRALLEERRVRRCLCPGGAASGRSARCRGARYRLWNSRTHPHIIRNLP